MNKLKNNQQVSYLDDEEEDLFGEHAAVGEETQEEYQEKLRRTKEKLMQKYNGLSSEKSKKGIVQMSDPVLPTQSRSRFPPPKSSSSNNSNFSKSPVSKTPPQNPLKPRATITRDRPAATPKKTQTVKDRLRKKIKFVEKRRKA
eukprot:TRINITY_DN6725_c0_g1_i1.p1 TRINITY_DN6725_c0_g1~~TRINITY_DN6725_c0_g1_i1.p1  ORF type:complete len:159 (+),score=47.15 TRINITY_DN6725_c0_g1_i1:46-477(+)